MSVYLDDGKFDRDLTLDGMIAAEEIAAFILRYEHCEAISGGVAHFTGLPLVELRGDRAVVTSNTQSLQSRPFWLPKAWWI